MVLIAKKLSEHSLSEYAYVVVFFCGLINPNQGDLNEFLLPYFKILIIRELPNANESSFKSLVRNL